MNLEEDFPCLGSQDSKYQLLNDACPVIAIQKGGAI